MKIKVRITSKYGKEMIYPACEKAELFCSIASARTLTRANINFIKQLGYEIEIVAEAAPSL
jgi:hypothetical protein